MFISIGDRRQHSLVRRASSENVGTSWFLIPRDRSHSCSPYLEVHFLRSTYASFYAPVAVVSRMVHVLLMTDSANSLSASHQCNLRTADRTTRLHLAYIRDLLNVIGFSYVTYAFNVADCGAKERGNVDIWQLQIGPDLVKLGFLTRKEFKSMVLLMKTADRRSSY